jgi:Fe-S-cluster-containing hydrogenase component 2
VILIDKARCNGCGVCVTACPQDAIVLEAETAEIREELCSGCGVCLSVCPEGAITDVEPAIKPFPSTVEVETTALTRPAIVRPAPAGSRPVKVIRSSPPAIERRRAVAEKAMTVGPVALSLLAWLAERWLRRADLPERSTRQRDPCVRGRGGGRGRRLRRRWRRERC